MWGPIIWIFWNVLDGCQLKLLWTDSYDGTSQQCKVNTHLIIKAYFIHRCHSKFFPYQTLQYLNLVGRIKDNKLSLEPLPIRKIKQILEYFVKQDWTCCSLLRCRLRLICNANANWYKLWEMKYYALRNAWAMPSNTNAMLRNARSKHC